MSLENLIEEFLLERGAIKVRFATQETLAGGPPSTDLSYQLEGARSAVSFALPLDRDKIRPYLTNRNSRGWLRSTRIFTAERNQAPPFGTGE